VADGARKDPEAAVTLNRAAISLEGRALLDKVRYLWVNTICV
jgi:hypothetical protein